ncbi:hypothetical protein SKAU_G00355210 [Synaphobranchus kaupii]|uniref:CBM21 domain-containing protein n=1 Tax=Synaphobranchus kaupii TaxID=118154 RepID=A0A9Q1EH74_SYNKA|nr:hypothetical protein SKAU_G00355210 [Synaphobranchus kaupii]
MNGTKVMHPISPPGHPVSPPVSPVSPMDLAACISQSPPLRNWLGISSPKMARSFNHLLSPPSSPDSPLSRSPVFFRKKRVMFADARGLALATGWPRLPASGATSQAGGKAPEVRPPTRGRHLRLWLGFPQPGSDFASFRARLKEELVLLESCSVTPESLSGKVRARNLGCEKTVNVRVTFDSWRSHRDVPCFPQQQSPPATDTELFAFDMPLPENLDPRERVEFCVSFRHGKGALLWDKNRGQNYRVHVCAESETPAASLLASHRSHTLPTQRQGLWVNLQRGAGHRLDYSPSSLTFRSSRKAGTDWRAATPPGSPRSTYKSLQEMCRMNALLSASRLDLRQLTRCEQSWV